MKRLAVWFALGIATLPHDALASGSLFPARYVACRAERDAGATPERAKKASDDRVPVPRRKAPPRLEMERLVVDDVAIAEPIPSAKATAPPERAAPRVVEGQNDYLCIGLIRGKGGILRVLEAPPGTQWAGHENDADWPLRNMRAAGAFDLGQAIPFIRKELERPLPEKVDYRMFERLAGKVAAARALADLGDAASAPKVRAFLREREDKDIPIPWQDTVKSLARLDPVEAQAYARDVVDRSVADPDHFGAHVSRIRAVLPLFTRADPTAVASLQKLSLALARDTSDTGWHDICRTLAVRVRLGDATLQKELRAELSTDLRTERGVMCYSDVIADAFPGNDPDELDTLFLRQRYEEILHLLATMRDNGRSGSPDPRFEAARKKIHGWLDARSSDPSVSAGPSDTRFRPDQRAMQLVALAFLGDDKARGALYALIDDPKDDTVAPWLAAYHALVLAIPGARDHAAVRLSLARSLNTRSFSTEPLPERGDVMVTEHGRVVDELARLGDDRFVFGLLDRDGFTRELTVAHLSRQKPSRACELVGDAAKGAGADAIQDAFWALSILGDACKPEMERLADNRNEPDDVRGMAIESLAMLRDPAAKRHLTALAKVGGTFQAAIERAVIILGARE